MERQSRVVPEAERTLRFMFLSGFRMRYDILMISVGKFCPSIYNIYKSAKIRDIDTLVKC